MKQLARITLCLAVCLALPVFAHGKGEGAYGKALSDKKPVTIADLLKNPEPYVGKTVKVEGRISDVCQKRGCWIHITDKASKSIRFKVDDGVIVFPYDIKGKQVSAEGVLTKLTLSHEQAVARAKHQAEEQGQSFDPNSVKGAEVVYQLKGIGAVVH